MLIPKQNGIIIDLIKKNMHSYKIKSDCVIYEKIIQEWLRHSKHFCKGTEVKNKKLEKWVKGPVYFKTGGEVETSGNMVDFYGTGVALNLPFEMHETPRGDGEVPKID